MIDITLCINKDCPKKESCLRWMIKTNSQWQSYATFNAPLEKGCDFYIKIKRSLSDILKGQLI